MEEENKDYKGNPLVSAKIAYFVNIKGYSQKRAVGAAIGIAKSGALKKGKWQKDLSDYYKKHGKGGA